MRFYEDNSPVVDTLSRIYPVGCLFLSVLPTNPADLLGMGTWVAFGAGRALVGVDAGDSDFDAAEKTSGAKTVTLTEAQIPAHTHIQDSHGHTITDPGHTHIENSNNTSTGPLRGWGAPDTSTNTSTATGFSTASATTGLTVDDATAVNQNTGGGEAHANIQPSIAVFMWKRTA